MTKTVTGFDELAHAIDNDEKSILAYGVNLVETTNKIKRMSRWGYVMCSAYIVAMFGLVSFPEFVMTKLSSGIMFVGGIAVCGTTLMGWAKIQLASSDKDVIKKLRQEYDIIKQDKEWMMLRKKGVHTEDGISLFVYGPKSAGKTTLLEQLGADVKTRGIGTLKDSYPSFKIPGTDIRIDEGDDIGGQDYHIEGGIVKKMLQSKDRVIFVFDAKKFISQENNIDINGCPIFYDHVVRARLHTLYKESQSSPIREKVRVVATHCDECGTDKDDVINKIKQMVLESKESKGLSELFNLKNFLALNLTSKSEIKLLVSNLF